MNRYFLILLLLFGFGCASVSSECLNDNGFKRFDSVLSKGITDDSGMNYYINDPMLLGSLRKELCKHIKKHNRITYFEMFSLLNEEREGVIYLHDSGQFFSFSQHNHNGKLIFKNGVNKHSVLYKLMIKFKEDFRWKKDTLENAYKEIRGTDAPLIKCIHVYDTSTSSFIIPYPYDLNE
jgi:hypothetical protein